MITLKSLIYVDAGDQDAITLGITLDGGPFNQNDTASFDIGLYLKGFAQFIELCSRSKWSKHRTKSPLLA